MEQTREDAESRDARGAGTRAETAALGEDLRAKAGETAGAVAQQMRSFAEEQKSSGADNVQRLGRAVHGAAEQLGRELPLAAGYIHSAADRLQSASSALRDRSVEDLAASFTDFADFARRQAGAAFVGSVLAGFALSRFLKSSSPSRDASRRS